MAMLLPLLVVPKIKKKQTILSRPPIITGNADGKVLVRRIRESYKESKIPSKIYLP